MRKRRALWLPNVAQASILARTGLSMRFCTCSCQGPKKTGARDESSIAGPQSLLLPSPARSARQAAIFLALAFPMPGMVASSSMLAFCMAERDEK